MNRWDIERRGAMYADHPILGPATRTLANLMRWTDENSDGWAYWPKPARAASALMEMIERDGTSRYWDEDRDDVTRDEYARALRPIKSFRTRYGATFEVVDA